MSFRDQRRGVPLCVPDLSRRHFVQGLAMGGVLAGFGLGTAPVLGKTTPHTGPQTLRGTDFRLDIGREPVNFTGSPAVATAINGSVPAPILRWREGDNVTLRVTNRLPASSSIHWHGIILPTRMDGVPGISFDGIAPGQTFTYRFKVGQTGTYWYHSHSGFQEQTGMYGAIVIDPRGRDPYGADRDYVVLLSDWTDEDPQRVYNKLKKLSHYYNRNERTFGDLMGDIRRKGVKGTWNDRRMWNDMRMSDRDLSDVTGYTYSFLMNGQTPADGWTGLFRRGEKVRLRFVNAAAMTFFDVRIPGLRMRVIAADGQDVEPVSIDEFRLGVAETLDVLVEPSADRAYSVFAQAIDRSGYARGTLTPDPSLKARVPRMDPVPILTHADMGMDMSSGAHAGHDMSAMGKDEHAGHDMSAMGKDEHAGHDMGAMGKDEHAGHDMSAMGKDEHAGHDMGAMNKDEHAGHDMGAGYGGAMDHSGRDMGGGGSSGMGLGRAGRGSNRPVVHAKSELGGTADHAREEGESTSDLQLVAGVRAWF